MVKIRQYRSFEAIGPVKGGKKTLEWKERLQFSNDSGVTWEDVPRVVDEAGLKQKEDEVKISRGEPINDNPETRK